jgi:hypothetical protein
MGFSVTTVQKALKGADYPATGEELADLAEGNGADQDLVDALREIGDAESPADVMAEMQDQLGDDED